MTYLEFAIVVLLVAILATVAIVQFQPSHANVAFQADRLRNDIRHMQTAAIAWQQSLKLVKTATGYQVECVTPNQSGTPCNGASGTAVKDPATSQDFVVSLETGIAWHASSPSSLEVDMLGSPVSGGTLLTSDPTPFQLIADEVSWTVSIKHTTGFVSVP